MKKGLPLLILFLLRLLTATLRFRVVDHCGVTKPGPDQPGPMIWIFWHNRILGMTACHLHYTKHRRARLLISPSRDGSLLADVMARIGLGSVRGSSSRRGAVAMKELLGVLENGEDVGITPDGPRGPVYQMAPGVVKLAEMSQKPVLPVRITISRYWELKSWDRFQIPKPFATVEVVLGPPCLIAEGCDVDAERERLSGCLGRGQGARSRL